MNLFVVDDEKHALNYIVTILKETYPNAGIFPFDRSRDAVNKAMNTQCDVAFLDIRIDEKNGIELLRNLRKYTAGQILFLQQPTENMLLTHIESMPAIFS